MQFVQSQNHAIKSELQLLLCPILCHLYIELLKGKDSHPAIEFLKRFAHIVAPVDNLETPLASKINGSAVSSVATHSSDNDTAAAGGSSAGTNGVTPSATTQITFLREPENEHTTHGYFKNLVQLMSTCLRIDELDSMEQTRTFRYGKYETELSLQALYALKHFLIKNGHVIILHVLQTWFLFDIIDGFEGPVDEDEALYGADSDTELTDMIDLDLNASKPRVNSELNVNAHNQQALFKRPPTFAKPAAVAPASNRSRTNVAADIKQEENPKWNHVRRAVLKLSNRSEEPIRVLKVVNSDNRLSCGDVDPSECHLVCGFGDSTVKLWQLNHSTIGGRKPFARFATRTCEWSLTNYDVDSSDDDDDDDDAGGGGASAKRQGGSRATYSDHTTETRDERSLRQWCHENVL